MEDEEGSSVVLSKPRVTCAVVREAVRTRRKNEYVDFMFVIVWLLVMVG